jgi:hypothetical protein
MLFLPMIAASREYHVGAQALWGVLDEHLDMLFKRDGEVSQGDWDAIQGPLWGTMAEWDRQFKDWLPFFRLTCLEEG